MRDRLTHDRQTYRTRVLACVVGALVLLIALVRFWPSPGLSALPIMADVPYENVYIEEVQQTTQSRREPPPPAPMMPVPVPNDVELPDFPIEFDVPPLASEDMGTGEDVVKAEGDAELPSFVAVADEQARPLRYVEPEFTREALRSDVRAKIEVRLTLDQQGRVTDAQIVALHRLDKQGRETEKVDALGYGIEEAVLAAAQRWRFRPGRYQGRAVGTYKLLEFKIGA